MDDLIQRKPSALNPMKKRSKTTSMFKSCEEMSILTLLKIADDFYFHTFNYHGRQE